MKYIKSYVPFSDTDEVRVIIRTNTYGSDIDFFLKMAEEAQRDFPDVPFSDMNVHHYAGVSYKGTYGIEFNTNSHCVPSYYSKQKSVEKCL